MLNCLKSILPLEAIDPKSRTESSVQDLREAVCGAFFPKHLLGSVPGHCEAHRRPSRKPKLRDNRRRPLPAHECRCCGGRFTSLRKSARYRSPKCRLAAWRSEVRTNETIGCNFLSSMRDRAGAASWSCRT